MGRKTKPEQPVADAPPTATELREARTVRTFLILFCGLCFVAGLGGIGSSNQLQAVFSAGYAVGALGGIIGFVAVGYGSRRWSLLVYLLVLGIPFLTGLALAAHGVRLDHLDLIERSREACAKPPTS